MKYLLIAIISISVIVVSLYLWGKSLPVTQVVTVKEKINAPIEVVWNIMTDWEKQPEWREEIIDVKITNKNKFTEFPKKGPAINFEVLKIQKPHTIELQMSGSVSGSYIAELIFSDGITTVIATEKVSNNSVFGRLISNIFFNLKDFAKLYLSQLKHRAERI